MAQDGVEEVAVLILGAGPTGLGAATRLQQRSRRRAAAAAAAAAAAGQRRAAADDDAAADWLLVDAAAGPGGLARTDVTPEGFLFDMGGHVIFSHWDYFDRAVDAGLRAEAEAEATAAAAAAARAAAAAAAAAPPEESHHRLADLVAYIRVSGAVAKAEDEQLQQRRAAEAAPAAAAAPETATPTSCIQHQQQQELWNVHQRVSYVWIRGRWVPYPFQNNLAALELEDQAACLEGLVEARCAAAVAAAAAAASGADTPTTNPNDALSPQTFDDWILRHLGRGIADLFMRPYNAKVWACPPSEMACGWLGERVAAVDLGRALRNALHRREDAGWGPNAVFRFPKHGGTGAIWRGLARRLPSERQRYGDAAVGLDLRERTVAFASGRRVRYGALVSTLPLDLLLGMCGRADLAEGLRYSSTHVIGVGVRARRGGGGCAGCGSEGGEGEGEGGPAAAAAAAASSSPSSSSSFSCPLGNKCWLYFPEDDCPFYRATVFSNYAEANVPPAGTELPTLCRADGAGPAAPTPAEASIPKGQQQQQQQEGGGPYWSLMFEVSESSTKPVDCRPTFRTAPGRGRCPVWPRVVLDTLKGAVATGLLNPDDEVVSLFHRRLKRGYPTPTLGRDAALDKAMPWLAKEGGGRVWSRGRFGAWRYELGNQDHALAQGVEAADAALAAVLGDRLGRVGGDGDGDGGAGARGAAVAVDADADADASEPTLGDADAANATKHATPVWDEYC